MPDDKKIIFVFTRDRPLVLEDTLSQLKNTIYSVFIIDDSFHESNQNNNRELLKHIPNGIYYGKNEFNNSSISHNLISSGYNSVYRQLGNKEWNLGYARNYALFLSHIHNANKVLFIDDDIVIPKEEIIINSFELLEQFNFVGASIGGMFDDSLLGYISTDLGLIDNDERTLSGGFLAFNRKAIRFPFLNIYNEDWIWLFLHSDDEKYLQTECVIQKNTNPYIGYENKILFQEYGEIFIIGILMAKRKSNFELLSSKSLWENVIQKRKVYLLELYNFAKRSNQKDFPIMIKWLLQNYSQYESSYFSEKFLYLENIKQKFEKQIQINTNK
jgi:hypothetical protein